MWALLGDVIVGRERRQNLEHLGQMSTLGGVWVLLASSTAPSRKDRAYPSSWVAINPQGNQPVLKASRLRIGTWSSRGEALTLEDSNLKWDRHSGILMCYEESPWDQPQSSSTEAL